MSACEINKLNSTLMKKIIIEKARRDSNRVTFQRKKNNIGVTNESKDSYTTDLE